MVCLMLFTCQKEEEPFHEQQVSLDIETVKQAFNKQFNKKAFSSITNDPLWENVLSYRKDNINYLEVPFRSLDQFDLELSTSISMDRLLASIGKDGNLSLNIVHYFTQDVNRHLPDFTQLNYTNPSELNGFVTLYDMDKRLISVNRYNNGKLSKGTYDIIKKKDKNNIDNLRVDEGCEMVEETIQTIGCWFWLYESGQVEIISCETVGYETISYEVCDGGDGGGGTTVVTQNTQLTPCDKVKSLNINAAFKAKIDYLSTKTGLQQETGFSQNVGGNYSALTTTSNGHSLRIPITNSTIGFTHTHIDNYEDGVDENGDPLETRPIKMFSPNDIKTFLSMVNNAKNNNIPIADVYASMVSSSGNYMLKFTGDKNSINTSLNISELNNKYRKYFNRYSSKERAFLNFVKNEISNAGISLFKIKSNGVIKEKKLKNNSTQTESNTCQ